MMERKSGLSFKDVLEMIGFWRQMKELFWN